MDISLESPGLAPGAFFSNPCSGGHRTGGKPLRWSVGHAYKGKPMSEQDARLWEQCIAEDLAEFRKAGLTHPMMADIEKELGVSP